MLISVVTAFHMEKREIDEALNYGCSYAPYLNKLPHKIGQFEEFVKFKENLPIFNCIIPMALIAFVLKNCM